MSRETLLLYSDKLCKSLMAVSLYTYVQLQLARSFKSVVPGTCTPSNSNQSECKEFFLHGNLNFSN